MRKIFCLAVVAASLIACKKDLEPQEPMYTSKDTSSTGETPAVAAAPATAQPVQQMQATQVTPQQLQAKTAPGMNPPHGQPGHRCDIAVGAPLNSAPAKTVSQPATVKPGAATIQTIDPKTGKVGAAQPVKAKTPTAPGMNPPHGEPGHRCDIAVGAPLNSAPVKTQATPAVTTPPLLTPPAEEKKE